MSQVVIRDTKPFQLHDTDTGSSDVQIVRLTDRINHLAKHLEGNQKDHSGRRGLLAMVNLRRRLLTYLRRESEERYKAVITGLGLRK
jgi:small subunit ribosomal protein S15